MVQEHRAQSEEEQKMARDVIRYIDTRQPEKILRIIGAANGLNIDDPISNIGRMTALMHASAVSGNTIMSALMNQGPDLSKQDS